MSYNYDRRTAAARLDTSLRRKINAELDRAGFGGKRMFRSTGEAVNVAMGVLSDNGLEQDESISADKFRGSTGHTSIHLAFSNQSDPFSPEAISNSMLAMQWTELRPGSVEVIAYLS